VPLALPILVATSAIALRAFFFTSTRAGWRLT